MTLKPFNQEKRNKKTMIIAGAVFLVAAVVLVAVSYSLYQKEESYLTDLVWWRPTFDASLLREHKQQPISLVRR